MTESIKHSFEFGLEVAVPCSTSNLGPGFDLLGLALSAYLKVRLISGSDGDGHRLITRRGEATGWPEGGDNLLFRALEATSERLGTPLPPLDFEVDSEIPLARGLGSSGAAIAAGVLLASAALGRAPQRTLGLELGAEMEGHPENSTASLLGGCILAVPTATGLKVVRQAVHPELAFVLAWPEVSLSTARARGALPETVPFADAVENPRRLALLLEGLRSGERELIAEGGQDRLHVRHRLPLIPGGESALEAARESGAWLATISGSGSALIAIGEPATIGQVETALASELERAAGQSRSRRVEVVHEAPEARKI